MNSINFPDTGHAIRAGPCPFAVTCGRCDTKVAGNATFEGADLLRITGRTYVQLSCKRARLGLARRSFIFSLLVEA